METLNKLVVVLGTNASGKSALGVRLAREFDGEVVSADSRQVYRRLDIGSGKLSLEEMRGVPHHLIDVADVYSTFTLSDYQQLAYAAIDDIISRGKTPFLVGGTGLYISATVEGYSLVKAPPNPERRGALNVMSQLELESEFRRITRKDLPASIDSRNRRRLIRAIEIAEAGFDPLNLPPSKPRYDSMQIGVTWPIEVLRERISRRLDERMNAGMLEETEGLLREGVPYDTLVSLGLEYRYLAWLASGELSYHEAITRLGSAISRFSRRQMSWFNRDKRIRWLNTAADYEMEARELVARFLSARVG